MDGSGVSTSMQGSANYQSHRDWTPLVSIDQSQSLGDSVGVRPSIGIFMMPLSETRLELSDVWYKVSKKN
jgi:hypothetical protein